MLASPRSAHGSERAGWRGLCQRACDGLVALGVLGAVVFAPLAFGAVHFWAYTALEAMLLATAAIWCVRTLTDATTGRQSDPCPVPLRTAFRASVSRLAAIGLALWLLVSIVPLPPSALGVLSPATYHLLQATLPGWPATAGYAALTDSVQATGSGSLFPPTWRPLALSPFLAEAELLRLLAYAIAFFVVAYYPWRAGPWMMRWLAHALIAVALFETAYALFQDATDSTIIFWYHKASASPSGTYINRNHFAGLLEMVAPLAAGLALGCWAELTGRFRADGLAGGAWWRPRAIAELANSPSALRLALYASATLWFIVACYRSQSRGGFLSPLAASCLLTPLLLRHSRSHTARWRPAIWLNPAVLVFGMALAVATADLPDLTRRLRAAELAGEAQGRLAATRPGLTMAADFPLAGVGVGNFEFTFPLYRDFGGERFTHAHNDYLELAVEAGIPALLLAMVLIAGLYRRAATALQAGVSAPYLLWGALVGVTALLLHSLADFNLHIPANALVFAVVSGVVVRLSASAAQPGPAAGWSIGTRALAAALVVLSLVLVVASRWDSAKAQGLFRRAYPDSSLEHLRRDPPRPVPIRHQVQALRPLTAAGQAHPFIEYVLGLTLAQEAVQTLASGATAAPLLEDAARHHAQAARALPQWAAPHLQLGVLGLAGVRGLTRDDAAACLARAVRLDPHNQAVTSAVAKVQQFVPIDTRNAQAGQRQ